MLISGVPAFDELLYRLAREHFGTVRDFATAVGYPNTAFSQIKAGHRPVPMEHIEGWADKLGLERGSRERERFVLLAAVTHVPHVYRDQIERLVLLVGQVRAEHEALRAEHESMRTELKPAPRLTSRRRARPA